MVKFRIDGLDVDVEDGWTLLEAARFYGIDIPTLCYMDGLSPYGGCRLCVVEVQEGKGTKLVSSCTYPVQEGIAVRTHSRRVINARKIIIELLLARSSNSKTIQDLASKYGVKNVRFKLKKDECILCGLCVRMCNEQMAAGAIDFVNRGKDMKVTTAFDAKSDVCRVCGGCIYVCPACMLRCQGPNESTAVCASCANMEPSCLDYYDDAQCFMVESNCGTCVREKMK